MSKQRFFLWMAYFFSCFNLLDSMELPPNDLNTELHHAIEYRNLELVKKIVIKEKKIVSSEVLNAQNEKGETPLHRAVKCQLEDVTLLLLECGVDPNIEDNEGNNPLYYAVELSFYKLASYLLAYGAFFDESMEQKLEAMGQSIKKNYPVHYAAMHNDVNFAKTHYVHSRACDALGRRPVFYAVQYDSVDLLEELLRSGTKVHETTPLPFKFFPIREANLLHIAAIYNSGACARLLIKKGCDINGMTKEGETPLYLAMQNDSYEVVRLLIENGASVHEREDKKSPLELAIKKDDIELALFMLSKFSGELEKNTDILYTAAAYDRVAILKWYVNHKIKLDDECIDLMFENAIENNALNVVKYLLSIGAKPSRHIMDPGGDPFEIEIIENPIRNDHLEMVDLLLRHFEKEGQSFVYDYEEAPFTPLQYARSESMVRLLLDKGVMTKGDQESGDTLLHWAARHGAFCLLKELIRRKFFDINLQNKDGETPLFCALSEGYHNFEMVEFLLNNGANACCQDSEYKQTPLHLAVDWINDREKPAINHALYRIIKMLIENGADINKPNHVGETVLHLAASRLQHKDTLPLIKFLLQEGAEVNIKDNVHDTPLDNVKNIFEESTGINCRDENFDETSARKRLENCLADDTKESIVSNIYESDSITRGERVATILEAGKAILLHGASPSSRNFAGLIMSPLCEVMFQDISLIISQNIELALALAVSQRQSSIVERLVRDGAKSTLALSVLAGILNRASSSTDSGFDNCFNLLVQPYRQENLLFGLLPTELRRLLLSFMLGMAVKISF